MPTFSYVATKLDGSERLHQNVIDASDQISARAMLRENGFVVQSIEMVEKKESTGGLLEKLRNTRIGPGKVPYKELAWASHRLASSQRKGISLTQTMQLMVTQKPKSPLAPALQDIVDSVNNGVALPDAFAAHQDILGQECVALVSAGYSSGTLEDALDQLAQIMRDRVENKASIRTALMGPVITLAFTLIMAFLLILFAIPKFASMLTEFGTKMPALTQYCIDIANSIKHTTYFWGLGILVVFVVWGYLWNHPKYGVALSRAMLDIPRVGVIINESILARIATTMGTLLVSGISTEEVLAHASQVAKNKYHAQLLLEIREMVRGGQTLSYAFRVASPLYSELVLAIQAGEEGGDLGESISKYARETVQEVNELNKTLKDAINPLLYLVVAVVVGFLAIALYLPILSSYSALAGGNFTPGK